MGVDIQHSQCPGIGYRREATVGYRRRGFARARDSGCGYRRAGTGHRNGAGLAMRPTPSVVIQLSPVVFFGDRVVNRRPQGDVVAALNTSQEFLASPTARGYEMQLPLCSAIHLLVEVAGCIVEDGVAGLRVETRPAGMAAHQMLALSAGVRLKVRYIS